MPQCFHCQQLIDSQAVICPHCRTPLKAYGHPGITLHRSSPGTYLCDTCTYHSDDSCNYPQRPYAQECTLYDNFLAREEAAALEQQLRQGRGLRRINWRNWYQNHPGLIGVGLLVVISFLITLLASRR